MRLCSNRHYLSTAFPCSQSLVRAPAHPCGAELLSRAGRDPEVSCCAGLGRRTPPPPLPQSQTPPLQKPETQPPLNVDRDPILSPDAEDNEAVSPEHPGSPNRGAQTLERGAHGGFTLKRNVDEVVLNITVLR